MKFTFAAGIAFLLLFVSPSYAVDLERSNVKSFIKMMVKEHDYDRDALLSILDEAEMKDSIIEQISKPAEKTLTWAEYRPIFLTKERIKAGATFWQENRAALDDGQKVLLRGDLTVYEARGQYQLIVSEIELQGIGIRSFNTERNAS